MFSRLEPIKGINLEELRRMLGLPVDDARWLLGLTINRWSEYVHMLPGEPVPPPLALLVRYYADNPSACPIPRSPSANELFTAINGTLKETGIILGREGVSGFRWVRRGGRMAPTVKRLAFHLMNEIEAGRLAQWRQRVEQEARARGFNDIWHDGAWMTKDERARQRDKLDKAKAERKIKRRAKAKEKKPSKENIDNNS